MKNQMEIIFALSAIVDLSKNNISRFVLYQPAGLVSTFWREL